MLSRLGGLASLAGIDVSADKTGAEAMAMLTSRKFLADFITERQLLPVLFADRWDPKQKTWSGSKSPPDANDGADYFLRKVLRVDEDVKTGFITLSVNWTDPQEAASWAAGLVERVNDVKRRRDTDEAQQKLDYLNAQLAGAALLELRQAISQIIEEQVSTMTVAQAQKEYAFRMIDPPIVPKKRIWPQRTLISIAALLFGGMLGSFLVLARHWVRGR